MTQENYKPKRPRSLSLPILRASRNQYRSGTLTLGGLLAALGEKSFGWAIVLFSLLTLLPLPPGSSVITSIPLLITTGQMAFGSPHVRLPGPLSRLRLQHQKLRRVLLGLRPLTKRMETMLRPRYAEIFRHERPLGSILLVIAVALFLPVPFSGWFPAISLFVAGVGILERDGLVALIGVICGVFSVLLTIAIIISLGAGAGAMIG